MKLHSKYFDSIRIARGDEPKAPPREEPCQWKGCALAGTHRAPKDRGQEGYYRFCLDHVRQFNASYDYFDGMSNIEVEQFQKSSATGHRPTWKMGENASNAGQRPLDPSRRYARFARDGKTNAHGLFEGEEAASAGAAAPEPRRQLRSLERRALETLQLPETASKAEIKARFKELVKRHHPDANGGDRGSEDKLREIIQAYNFLKQAGLV